MFNYFGGQPKPTEGNTINGSAYYDFLWSKQPRHHLSAPTCEKTGYEPRQARRTSALA